MSKAQTKKKTTPAKAAKPASKTYGSKPLWQWIVLYMLVGAVVYLIIYLWFFGGNGSGGAY